MKPRRPLQNHEAAAAIPIAEVARFTGCSTTELMDLVRQGVLEQISGRHRCELTATSLRKWMSGREPDGDKVRDINSTSPRPAVAG